MKVGVVGLGIMGGAFSRNLLDSGFEVSGYDIVQKNMMALQKAGGHPAASPRDVAKHADVLITSLPSIAAFHEVMAGKNGIAAANKKGLIVVEASTLPLDDKKKGHDVLAESGATLLDCPISGTGSQAKTRDLAVYASGKKSAYKKAVPALEGFARAHYYVGPFGHGSKMKFVANHLVHIHNVASAEAMVLGMKAGLDPHVILEVIKDGAGNSKVFELRAPMMADNDYNKATMKIDVWQKDMKVIGEFAAAVGAPTPVFQACIPMYIAALAQGLDKKDTAAVCAVLEEMAGLERD